MPTHPRKHQLSGSLVYHIFNRSNAKVPIFKSRADFEHFKKLLAAYASRFSLKIYHWVIMPNHFHLLLELADPAFISRIMAGITKAYTTYHHAAYRTVGLLWQGRFKMQPVQKQRYLIACGRYIERNPVKDGLVKLAHEYDYSSARFYCTGTPDSITTLDPFFLEFGVDPATRRTAYTKFLTDLNDKEEGIFDALEGPVGTKEFVKRLLKSNGRMILKRGRPPRRIVS